jgi:hypothetical protein
VLSLSAFHVFATDANRLPIPVGIATTAPIALFLLWFAVSAEFRRYVGSLNPRTLTIVQAWRIGGFVFLVLHAHAILPGVFALPAGWGDIAVGATAPLVAMKLAHPDRRRGFILWQALGMLDLGMAVTLGVLAPRLDPAGPSTGAMTVLPLSLIPTFAVPLLLILHIICIAQARSWVVERRSTVDGPGDVARAPLVVS